MPRNGIESIFRYFEEGGASMRPRRNAEEWPLRSRASRRASLSFNEASAKCRGMGRRPREKSPPAPGFNEASAKCRGMWLVRSPHWPLHRPRFNEASAKCRGMSPFGKPCPARLSRAICERCPDNAGLRPRTPIEHAHQTAQHTDFKRTFLSRALPGKSRTTSALANARQTIAAARHWHEAGSDRAHSARRRFGPPHHTNANTRLWLT